MTAILFSCVRSNRVRLSIGAAMTCLMLSACGDTHDSESPTTAPDASETEIELPPRAPGVKVADVIAADPGVRALGFWSHPSLAFNSMIIAGGAEGLKGYTIETLDETVTLNGAATDIAIGYDGVGADAVGYVAALDETRAVTVVAIDNATRQFDVRKAANVDADAICLLDTDEDRLISLTGDDIYFHAVDQNGVGERLPQTTDIDGRAIECAGRSDTGDVYVLTDDTTIHVIKADGSVEVLGQIGITDPASFDVILREQEIDGATQLSATLAIVSKANGRLYLFDGADGHALGAAPFIASFDHEGIDIAITAAAGFDNYGAVYRDGAIVVATPHEGSVELRMAPWNAVLNTVQQPLGQTVSARQVVQEEDTGFELDISLPQP